MITNLKVGDWVVDDFGEWAKITKIDWEDDSSSSSRDQIWGYWSGLNEENCGDELFTNRYCIVSKHRTKKEARKYAEFVASLAEENDAIQADKNP